MVKRVTFNLDSRPLSLSFILICNTRQRAGWRSQRSYSSETKPKEVSSSSNVVHPHLLGQEIYKRFYIITLDSGQTYRHTLPEIGSYQSQQRDSLKAP